MPSLPKFNVKLPKLNGQLNLGRSGSDVVGLDIQPGFAGAVKASVNGSILAERAACLPLGQDVIREGEVVDGDTLSQVLRELFTTKGLGKRVRVGVANQRTVMRTLELPPVTDRKELAAAVSFQAQDQVPMPLSNAVLDFHPLGIIDTPGGPRQHVVLVAAQLDMVEHLLMAVRGAGLQPVGIDLSAFALIRSLYLPQPDSDEAHRVVYLNVDGLTNLAIAEGSVCRFTRVVGGGMEGMAGELAERLGISLADARAMLLAVDLRTPDVGQVAPEEIAAQGLVGASPDPADAIEWNVAPEEVSPDYVAPAQTDSGQAPPAGTAADAPTDDGGAPDAGQVAPEEIAAQGLEAASPDAADAIEWNLAPEEVSPHDVAPAQTDSGQAPPAPAAPDAPVADGGAPGEAVPDETTTYHGVPADAPVADGGAPGEAVPDETTTYRGVPADALLADGGAPGEAVPDETTTYRGVPAEIDHEEAATDGDTPDGEATDDAPRALSPEDHDALEGAMSFTEMSSVPAPATPTPAVPQEPPATSRDSEAQMVLENGIREIAGEVRNSLDFHRSQEGGGEVSHVVLSGSVLDVPGFADALQGHLGLEVRAATVRLVDESADPSSMHRLAVAAGLATEELRR